jgi:RND family efflux transporter MFP subunit
MSLKQKSRIAAGVLAAVMAICAAAYFVFGGQKAFGTKPDSIPTVRVQRGILELKVFTTGELRPARSATLVAPAIGGGTLQLVELLKTGTRVKKGDVVAEFDKSEQEYNLEQARIELLQAEQEITKAKADAEVQASQDKVALLRARFDVRRAELEVSKNELVSSIDAKKNEMALAEAKRRLAQLEADIQSRAASARAGIAVLEARRNRARMNMANAERNIQSMTLVSPIDGLVSVKEAQTDFYFTGMTLPELRPGDVVWPGRPVAEVLEVSQMEILAKVSENDRGNISPGQPVEVRVDAYPGQTFTGTVKNVAAMAARSGMFGARAAERKFDATFQMDSNGREIPPGVTAQVIIVGEQLRDALFLPRQAIFEKDNKPIVYLLVGDTFQPREVKITKRTESKVAIEGLKEGDEVALVNPETQRRRPGKAPAGPTTPAAAQ